MHSSVGYGSYPSREGLHRAVVRWAGACGDSSPTRMLVGSHAWDLRQLGDYSEEDITRILSGATGPLLLDAVESSLPVIEASIVIELLTGDDLRAWLRRWWVPVAPRSEIQGIVAAAGQLPDSPTVTLRREHLVTAWAMGALAADAGRGVERIAGRIERVGRTLVVPRGFVCVLIDLAVEVARAEGLVSEEQLALVPSAQRDETGLAARRGVAPTAGAGRLARYLTGTGRGTPRCPATGWWHGSN